MEKSSKQLVTAQDLFEFLKEIPEGHRTNLPLVFATHGDEDDNNGVYVDAFRTFETEGCLEQGFRFNKKL